MKPDAPPPVSDSLPGKPVITVTSDAKFTLSGMPLKHETTLKGIAPLDRTGIAGTEIVIAALSARYSAFLR